jgi:hypothetical protein
MQQTEQAKADVIKGYMLAWITDKTGKRDMKAVTVDVPKEEIVGFLSDNDKQRQALAEKAMKEEWIVTHSTLWRAGTHDDHLAPLRSAHMQVEVVANSGPRSGQMTTTIFNFKCDDPVYFGCEGKEEANKLARENTPQYLDVLNYGSVCIGEYSSVLHPTTKFDDTSYCDEEYHCVDYR